MTNYFNNLSLRQKLEQLGKCRFMSPSEFSLSTKELQGKKIVIIGCGAQGLNQGLCLKESGLDVSYALRPEAIAQKRKSYINATENGFKVGTYQELIPSADLVINLTPDKQHSAVVAQVAPLLKPNSAFGYSHGFNVIEEGVTFDPSITVIMMAPKAPGSEVLKEFRDGFGVPTLICVHPDNDPSGRGIELAKAWAFGTGGNRAGVLESSFVAEVKSDLVGEQTILCGMMQAGTVFAYDYLVQNGSPEDYAVKLIQNAWAVQSNAVKLGGLTLLLDRFSPYARQRVIDLADFLKIEFKDLYYKHMDDVISGQFSADLIVDWNNGDKNLLAWRKHFSEHPFENIQPSSQNILDQEYYDQAVIIAAFIKAGVELAFETMVDSGIKEESAYYESLHELPLLANLIQINKLYQMNLIISDTAEYGNYLFALPAIEILKAKLPAKLINGDIGTQTYANPTIDNYKLDQDLRRSRKHPIEKIGTKLRSYMAQARISSSER